MREQVLPLFPLPLVLFPNTGLPLHIFEDRYKEMIGEVITAQSEFGVVLARDQGVLNAGCSAQVEQVLQRYPDGRLDILTRGTQRFEVLELVDGKSYLRAQVRFFDDERFEPTPMEIRRRAVEGYSVAVTEAGEERAEPEWNDPQLSFQLAQILTDLDFRQQLLALRSERDRMQRLADFFPTYVSRLKMAGHVRAVAPKNGFARIDHHDPSAD